jgi:zinc transporter ZupT
LFFLGFGILTVVARRVDDLAGGTVLLAYLVAAGIGVHALGEGMIVGNNLAGGVAIEDLSTLAQGFSFALHKFLEGFTIAVFLTPKSRAKVAGICTILAGAPIILGILLGFFTYPAILANVLFAAGAGAVMFIMLRIARSTEYEKHLWQFILAFLVGFMLVYIGSLVHFAEIAGP